MKLLISLLILPIAWSYEEKEIVNPILPLVLGPTYITYTHQTTYYHINLKQIQNCLNDLENSLTTTKIILTKRKPTEHFSHLVKEKVDQSYELLHILKLNTQLFHKTSKQKRGLINAVGKINKWLFGTLDSDDEQKYDQYINAISNNQHILQNDVKQAISVLSNVTQTYTSHLNKIEENQKIIRNKLALLEIQEISISDALYLSLIVDNINVQLSKIKSLLDNIETAISFAQLNIMHNTILNELQLEEIKNNIPKENIIQFSKIINYYKIITPQVKILKDFIIFTIHMPIIHPTQFTLYKLFPIPIHNQTIILPKPYILLAEEKYYSTDKECLKIEDTFLCPQESLSKEESCVAKLLTHNENTCPAVKVHYTSSSVKKINDKEILVIPAEPVTVVSNCQELKRSSYIHKPTLITMDKCPLEINDQLYTIEKTNNLYFSLNMPPIEIKEQKEIPHLQLQEIDHQEIKEVNKMISTIKFHNLQTLGTINNHWKIPIVLVILCIIIGLSIIVWKTNRCRRHYNNKRIKNTLQDIELQKPQGSENRQPLFSELKEGGVM